MAETVKPQLASHDHCTGCGACASGCPKGAVHMVRDKEGFLYPPTAALAADTVPTSAPP